MCTPSRLKRPRPQPKRISDFGDRKSTRLNSSHGSHSYAVFCLKKKNCTIGAFCMIGMGDTILNVAHIGEECIVAACLFVNEAPAAEIYTLSIHDALQI